MLRKAYVPGAAALLAAALLLTGCTDGSSDGGQTDNANQDGPGTATVEAQPGKYHTLPEACGAVGHATLDSLLPGIKQITDPDQRDRAYQGEATLTYDTDRKVGCRWKVDSTEATDRLHIDLERVVSYDNSVSDDSQAQSVFATKQADAHLPVPATTPSGADTTSGAGSGSGSPPSSPGAPSSSSGAPSPSSSGATPSSGASSASPPVSDPADLQPRTLDDLGDEGFLDDQLSSSGSTAKQRTVTVAFRTSNVIVTIEYEEQPAAVGVVPDSEEMQDKARKLAARLADSLGG
ncbi:MULTISPECIES: DUF3558 domain-containing protein [unclassified Streptomyces]|uniref:DUF3558 domain-containing protein n=1 Tax=unclassified Streptomyces TaxID=2593676 RepID=UPI0027417FF2|nr:MULTISPECIES: DUF3558 domain-containing protein [unclassified Streptomyces]